MKSYDHAVKLPNRDSYTLKYYLKHSEHKIDVPLRATSQFITREKSITDNISGKCSLSQIQIHIIIISQDENQFCLYLDSDCDFPCSLPLFQVGLCIDSSEVTLPTWADSLHVIYCIVSYRLGIHIEFFDISMVFSIYCIVSAFTMIIGMDDINCILQVHATTDYFSILAAISFLERAISKVPRTNCIHVPELSID